nr:YlxR family protein [Mesoplasma photuris]
MKKQKVSLRRDVVSKQLLPKNELIRIVKNKSNEIFIDQSQKADGRGVWIKSDIDSIKKARQKNLLSKGLKTKLNLDIYDQLEREING